MKIIGAWIIFHSIKLQYAITEGMIFNSAVKWIREKSGDSSSFIDQTKLNSEKFLI